MKNFQLFLSCCLSATLLSCNNQSKPIAKAQLLPGEDDQKTVQTALINVKPGDTLFFGEGKFNFQASVSMEGVDSVVLKGVSHDKTIFSFKNQTEGAEGVKISNVNTFTIQDIGIEDTKGDGIKIDHSENIVMRRVRTEWTNGADSSNGSYGLYPVSSKNVLMEECVAIGASDAGIYVGQSENAIVRRNIAERNVAGIEVENTDYAEVYENTVTNNTAGIMIFDLPDLPEKNGKYVKIYKNKIMNNNHPNFSKRGIAIFMVPSGTGLLLMACQHVDAYENEISGNNTMPAAIIKLIGDQKIIERQQRDSLFNIYPSSVYVHDNNFTVAPAMPDTTRAFGRIFFEAFGMHVPTIYYDGSTNPELAVNGKYPDEHRICIRNNGAATFFNSAAKSTEVAAFDCEFAAFPVVQLP
ncbi:MAG: parallel beta-helix domain-containing protein [Chitinophagales bacterium]|nr:parallel beta-helix domain-containing protein [Chitinophagales bacterium]